MDFAPVGHGQNDLIRSCRVTKDVKMPSGLKDFFDFMEANSSFGQQFPLFIRIPDETFYGNHTHSF